MNNNGTEKHHNNNYHALLFNKAACCITSGGNTLFIDLRPERTLRKEYLNVWPSSLSSTQKIN